MIFHEPSRSGQTFERSNWQPTLMKPASSLSKSHFNLMITMENLHFSLMLSSLALFLSHLFASGSADVLASINCGSSSTITDSNLKVWIGDSHYIQNGEVHVVSVPITMSPVLSTLRAFTTHKKNCYSLEVNKGSRNLFRASFYYGNYDNKSSPPSFDIHLDGNYWATVETSNIDVVYYEVIYIVKGDLASVCLAQTKPNQFPFISALETRNVDIPVYSNSDFNKPPHLRKRDTFGVKDVVRLPDGPTSDKTLSALINIKEAFSVGAKLIEGTTNTYDVQSLLILQFFFTKLLEWTGDPCIPYRWDWVACSSDPSPRITALYLSNHGLVGYLPEFSDMDALVTIDLSKNSLSGPVPPFLGTFPRLKNLNLADNDFSGTLPSSLSKNKNIKLDISGNPNLCSPGKSCEATSSNTGSGTMSDTTPSASKRNALRTILAIVLPILIVFWLIGGVIAIHNHRIKAGTVVLVAGHPGGMPGVTLPSIPTTAPSNTSFQSGMYNGQDHQDAPATSTTTHHNYHDVLASQAGQNYHQNVPPPSPGGEYEEVPLYTATNDVETGKT